MAYDKVIDSAVLDAGLTQVADALRTAGGTAAAMAFPSGFVAAAQALTPKLEVHTVTIASDLGNGIAAEKTLLTANPLIKAHYADEGLSAIFVPVNAANIDMSISNTVPFVYQCNRSMMKANTNYYGFRLRSNGATAAPSVMAETGKLSSSPWNVSLRAKDSGNLNLYVAANFTVKAGSYYVIIFCAEP